MNIFKEILKAIGNILDSFFSNDMDVMSPEAKRILSHPEDSKKYCEALDRIKLHKGSETIILSTGEEITLI